MSINQLTTNLNNHQSLSDNPNANEGLTATELKVLFDKAANDIKTYINTTLIPALESTTAGSSGAKQIGLSAITGLTGATVQDAIEWLKTRSDQLITTAQITDLAVTTAKLNDLAVTTAKIANLAVTDAKLADSAVTEGKIANLAITSGKIADLQILTAKINDLAVTTAKLANLSVTEGKIADGAVTTDKLGNGAVTNGKIATNTITADKLVAGTLDSRYYTETEIDSNIYSKTQVQTSGQALIHWDNVTNKPAFGDSSWKQPVATVSALPATGNTNGDLRLVLDTDLVYTWDSPTSAWKLIGASGSGVTSHSSLTNLNSDDHLQYLRTDGTRALTGDMNFNKYEAQNLVVHNASTAPTTPDIGQLWYDVPNNQLKVYKGVSLGWVDVSGQGAVILDKEFTATAGQTAFDLSSVGQYAPGTNALSVFINGVLQMESAYTETSSTVVTLNSGASAGQKVYVKWFYQDPAVLSTFATKTYVDTGLATKADTSVTTGLQTQIDSIVGVKTATITTTWTGASAPFTQVVNVSGVTANDEPIISPIYSTTNATAILERTAWNLIGSAVTGAGTITFTCFETKPTTAINIQIKGV